jgi:hypothetical protein
LAKHRSSGFCPEDNKELLNESFSGNYMIILINYEEIMKNFMTEKKNGARLGG